MDIEEDCPVFFRVFNPALHLVGLGVGLEVDHIATVFLQGEDFLDGGMVPLGGLYGAFAAGAVDAPAPPIIGRVDDPLRTEGGGNFRQPAALQRHLIDALHHSSGLRVNHPKARIVRVFNVAIGRRGERNPGVAFHLIDDPALLGNVLGVVFVHNIFERGEIVLTLVAVHTVGHRHQTHIMEREKFLGELANLNVVPAQPGEVFHEHRRDVSGLDCGNHFLKAGAFHGSSGDTVIHKRDCVHIALVFRGLLENFLLGRDLSRGI